VVIREIGGEERQNSPEKIAVFLQMGTATRKTLVSLTELSLQGIRLLFVEKFQFNPGVDTFPDILITDRETGVRYILEEGAQDITEGTVLTLDVEGNPPGPSVLCFRWLMVVDSTLKKTFTEGMQALMKEMGTLQKTILSQQSMLASLTEQHTSLREDLTSHRDETIQKIQDITLKPPTISPTSPRHLLPTKPTPTNLSSTHHLSTIKSLKQDLSTLRTDHKTFQSNLESSLSSLRSLPLLLSPPQTDPLSDQKSRLESSTQHLVTLSDDLSDQVDDLRIDITQKRIRPHPRVLTAIRKQENLVTKELDHVEQLLRQLKPVWKRKWEEELQQVIDGQEFLRHQETLVGDLRKDLVDTQTVVTQIVQAAEILESSAPPRREWLSGGLGSGGRDAVLGEVKTLQPNSQDRLEAIKRAERMRLRELEMRKESEFQVELTEVVTEGKLRIQSEGAKRVEKEREEKDQRIRQQLWEARNPQATGAQPKRSNDTTPTPTNDDGGKMTGETSTSVKRTVSEGNSAFAEQQDDGVARSQSHSSGLSRMKAVSGGSSSGSSQGKRGSGIMDFVKRTSSSLASSRSSGSHQSSPAGVGVIMEGGYKDDAGVE
jgi:hypothetical protein